MSKFRRLPQETRYALAKTGSYYVMHILVAATVAYLVTGNLAVSLTLSLLEPTVQAFAYFFHEKAWTRALQRKTPANETPADMADGIAEAA